MTFLELYNKLVQATWPEGLARNLIAQAQGKLRAALIDLQLDVPMLQGGQTVDHDQGATFWKCGVSLVTIPVLSVINRVEVFPADNECCKVSAWPVTKEQMECRSNACGKTLVPPAGAPDDHGVYTAGPDNDPRNPPGSYLASIIDDILWVYPAIPSTHKVRVTWTGVKRVWLDTDALPDTWMLASTLDPEIFDYLQLALTAYKFECDPGRMQVTQMRFIERRKSMVADPARKESHKLQLSQPCVPCHYRC